MILFLQAQILRGFFLERNPHKTPETIKKYNIIYISDDSVFLGNKPKSHVEEYVLNDVGKVYTGSYKRPIGRDWAFGQFEETVLPAAVYILDKVPSIIDVESVGEGGGIHKIQFKSILNP